MPSYRFYLDTSLNERDLIQFKDEEYKHIVKVMRLEVGDLLEIVNGKGTLAHGRIREISKHSVSCLIETRESTSAHSPRFIIAQSLLKPSSLELLCEKNTELGALEIWFFPADLSEKDGLSEHQMERLHKHAIGAVKQSGRLFTPTLQFFSSLKSLLSISGYDFFYGDIGRSAPMLTQAKFSSHTPVFVVGPEKGFTEDEALLLKSYGAKGVSLGQHVLRAETASMAASALLGCLTI